MLKKEARNFFRRKRAQLSAAQKMKLDDLLLIKFQQMDLPFLSIILSFYPIEENNEINTFIITDYLQFKNPGLQIAYPKTNLTDNTMGAVICDHEMVFEKNRYNILEPLTGVAISPALLDAVLVPVMTFDTKGNRVGYGKGFYDLFLKQCNEDCFKIGLSYFEPVDVIEDANGFDVPLDLCITPQNIYVF